MKRLLFDIETDGLLEKVTKVHCGALVNVDTGDCFDCKGDEIDVFVSHLSQADVLIGHNIQRFDLPVLKKLYGFETKAVIRDTMICARVLYPNVKETDPALVHAGTMPPGKDYQGKHTLAAWGYRLGVYKGDYAKVKEAEALSKGINDPEAITRYVWGTWNEEMHRYMLQDIETNYALWKKLRVDDYSQAAIDLEHRIAALCDTMEAAGVPFDTKAASQLHSALAERSAVIERDLVARFGSWTAPISPDPQKATFIPKRDNAKLGYKKGVPVLKTKTVVFNPQSRDHIAKVLIERGWVPEKLTEGGKPQIDEEVVTAVAERYPEFAGLAEYMMVKKRLSQLALGDNAWLYAVKDHWDMYRIHGVINPMGTTTSRASHYNPNLAQVPAVKSPYGAECRGLFYAPDGWRMVGADQQGLELRGLAHYLHPMDGGKYASIVLEGDIHWAHAQAMGLVDGPRDKDSKLHTIIREDGSKRFIYAYIYGCGDAKAGEIIYGCVDKARREGGAEGQALYDKFFPRGYSEGALKRVGREVRNDFAQKIDGFAALKTKLDMAVNRNGWLPGLDGRRIPVRSEHSALNFLIQSAGAIICKRWAVESFDALRWQFKYDFEDPWRGDFVFGLWVHDEVQVWTREHIADEVAKVLVWNASKAGEPYGFRVRLDGSAKIGRTWAETH